MNSKNKKSIVGILSVLCVGLGANFALGGRTVNRVVKADLSPVDSTCNQVVRPSDFKVERFEEVDVELSVPRGTSVLGWKCVKNVCKKTFVSEKSYLETLMIDNGDPSKFGGARMFVNVGDSTGGRSEDCGLMLPDGNPENPDCSLTSKPVCCACPCDFAPVCG